MLRRFVIALCWIIGVGGIAYAAFAISQHMYDSVTPLDNSTHALRAAGDKLATQGLDPKLVLTDVQAGVLVDGSGDYFSRTDCSPVSPGSYYARSCSYFNGKSSEDAIRQDEQTVHINTYVEPVRGETRAYDGRVETFWTGTKWAQEHDSTSGQTHVPLDVNGYAELKGAVKAFCMIARSDSAPSGITITLKGVTIQVWLQNGDQRYLLRAAQAAISNLK